VHPQPGLRGASITRILWLRISSILRKEYCVMCVFKKFTPMVLATALVFCR